MYIYKDFFKTQPIIETNFNTFKGNLKKKFIRRNNPNVTWNYYYYYYSKETQRSDFKKRKEV